MDRRAARENERMMLRQAPAADRPALAALLALDRALGQVLRTTREPLVGQIRLAWWRDALIRLDTAPPPAEPVLSATAVELVTRGVTGAALAAMVDGWEALLGDPLDDAALGRFATTRGAGLFGAAAVILKVDDGTIVAAGEGWALTDLAGNIGDADVAARARTMAGDRLAAAFAQRWSRRARPLGVLALLARGDLAGIAPGSPRRIARLLVHRLTGR